MAVRDCLASRFCRLATAGLVCLILAGCASPAPSPPAASPPAPSTSTTYSGALCSAAAEFQNSANALVSLDAKQVGIDGVQKALQDLQNAATRLGQAAQDQFGPQVAELQMAIASLRGTIAGLGDQDSLSTNLGKIATAVGAVEQAAKPIMDSVRTGCPSVPPASVP